MSQDKVVLVESDLNMSKRLSEANTKNKNASNGAPATAPSKDGTLESRFLRLPAELRNRIYEDAFSNNYKLTLEGGIPEPPLLRTCKQVRNEGMGIFYSVGLLEINHLTAELFERKRQALLTKHDILISEVHINPEPLHAKNWKTCILLMQCFHNVQCRTTMHSMLVSQSIDPEIAALRPCTKLAIGMARVVHTMKARPWDEVKTTLELLRPALAELGPSGKQWASD